MTEDSPRVPASDRPSRWFRNPVIIMVIALLMTLVGGWGSGLVKSGAGSVEVKQLRWESPSGHLLAAQLFVPRNATAQAPAPAIVAVHGWMLDSEYQDANYIELARRGYVVLSIDMYGHGASDSVPTDDWWKVDGATGANGVYDGVKLLATLPYVNASQIGVTGNSNGATGANLAVMLDNEAAEPLISSVFLVVNEPIAVEGQALIGEFGEESNTRFYNVYGSRDAGLVAVQHDEIFNRVTLRDGTLTSPRDFLDQATAQSFLAFGRDPSGAEHRDAGVFYREDVDGTQAIRVIDNPDMLHLWSFVSPSVVADTIGFFEQAMPAPAALDGGDQVWQWRAVFGAIGLAGLLLFLVSFTLVMLRTRLFGSLAADRPVFARAVDRKGKAWLWGGSIAVALFAAVSYPVVFVAGVLLQPAFLPQQQTFVIGVWLLAVALFTTLVLLLTYRRHAKGHGLDLRATGVVLERGKIGRTILLGSLAAVATYGLVFVVDYLFATDLHVWMLGVNAFESDKLVEILRFLPFFVVFWVVSSIASNVFGYVRMGKREWVNTAVVAVLNTLGLLLLFVFFYAYFFATGLMPTDGLAWGLGSMMFWVVGLLVVLPLATVGSRIIYHATRNPYLPAIMIALFVTTMLCARTLTTSG